MSKYDYSIDNPPYSCMDCEWHNMTFLPETQIRSRWADYCGHLKMPFWKMHIVLRGEYRSMTKHDEDDLKKHLPFECPYYDTTKAFWEMYGRIQMIVDVFIYECSVHFMDYFGFYVLTLSEHIPRLEKEIPQEIGLHYLPVKPNDEEWYKFNFGENTVVLSPIPPGDWSYNPPKPV